MFGFDNKALQAKLGTLLTDLWSKSAPIAKHESAVNLANSKFNLDEELKNCEKADDYQRFFSSFLKVPEHKRKFIEKAVRKTIESACDIKLPSEVDPDASTDDEQDDNEKKHTNTSLKKSDDKASPAFSLGAKQPSVGKKETVGSAATPPILPQVKK